MKRVFLLVMLTVILLPACASVQPKVLDGDQKDEEQETTATRVSHREFIGRYP